MVTASAAIFAMVTLAQRSFAVVTLTSAILPVVTLALAIFAVVTLPSRILSVVTASAAILAVVTASAIFPSKTLPFLICIRSHSVVVNLAVVTALPEIFCRYGAQNESGCHSVVGKHRP